MVLAKTKRLKAEEAKAKREQSVRRAEIREAKAKIKTRGEYIKEAQAAFNSWIRERDYDQPCISCGRLHQGQYHAGHYLTVGAHPELRFEPDNAHKQCAPCNDHLSGNLIEYRKRLLVKIGPQRLEWLEGDHPAKHYSIEELVALTKHYREEKRKAEKARGMQC